MRRLMIGLVAGAMLAGCAQAQVRLRATTPVAGAAADDASGSLTIYNCWDLITRPYRGR